MEVKLGGSLDAIGSAAVRDVIEVHFENLVFGIEDFSGKGENSLFKLAAESAFGSEESNFDQLLSDGGAAL